MMPMPNDGRRLLLAASVRLESHILKMLWTIAEDEWSGLTALHRVVFWNAETRSEVNLA
jgi:hypothetical protein